MALVHGWGWRGCSVLLLAHVIACSDDGVPATSDDPSDGGTTGTATMSGTDSTMTGTTAESSITDTGPESTGPGTTATTADDTSGTATGPSDTSSAETGTESSTGEPSEPCVDASDCQIVDNCCECTVIPAGVEPDACEKACEQSTCSALGVVPIASCELGTCELVETSCDPSLVTCESKPPVCPEGSLPGVNPLTSCWTDDCVPQEFCDVIPSGCDACGPDEVCVQNVAQMITIMCVPIARDCNGTPTCECMGEVCQDPFGTCNDDGDGIDCICIAC